jgi:lysophospholipid acyltransferase (LPLAT)-like uncharacterized protein
MSAAPETPSQPSRARRAGGVIVPHPPRWHQRLIAWLIYVFIRTVAATLRYRWDDRSQGAVYALQGPALFCVWHNRLALCLIAYYAFARQRPPTAGMATMVSASRDGAFLTGILDCFKVQPVRGSSSRRGPQALLELTTWAERGYDLSLTPDGPRGPRYVVQDGVMSLAQVTGLPIIPFSYNLTWKVCLKSWDRFQIPLPFARCEMNIGMPLRVPRHASDEERQALRQQLQQTLRNLSTD